MAEAQATEAALVMVAVMDLVMAAPDTVVAMAQDMAAQVMVDQVTVAPVMTEV
jgi:hypothetical protein